MFEALVSPDRRGYMGLDLVRRQGSQVSMRVARGSASWLSSHGRGRKAVRDRLALQGGTGDFP